MAKIRCKYASNVSSSSCFARCKRCLAAMVSSLRSKRKASSCCSCFSLSKLFLFSDLLAYFSALSVKQTYSLSNFFSSDHPFLLAIRSNFILKNDQDKLVRSPENSCRHGVVGGEWRLLELSPEVDLFERDFLVWIDLGLYLSVLLLFPPVRSVQFVQ